jgi:RND family efflux transporter MFP subunit
MVKKIYDYIHSQPLLQRRLLLVASAVLILLLMLMMTRVWASIVLHYRTMADAAPTVATVKVKCLPAHEHVVLPATIAAWHEAPIYARTNGYVKQWVVDIGDKVNKGDLLAIIETPELDDQLRQAEADLNVAIARDELAQITAKRWELLVKTDSVSKQARDEKVDFARETAARVIAARANRDRLRDLVSFERVIAPFSGTISDRATDIGALINAGHQANVRPLFRMVQTNKLRIYVKIPENYAPQISAKMQVQLVLAEYPGQTFEAKLFQTAGAIDPLTRTLLAQFTIDNAAGLLLPGSYTEMHFSMPLPPNAIRIPVNTLLFRSEGLQVATLTAEKTVALKSITISRDFGETVEIDSGLKPGELVIVNPDDSIFNGQHVRLIS